MIISAIVLDYFNPIALQIGPIVVRWYSLAYIFGIIGGLLMVAQLNSKMSFPVFTSNKQIEDMLLWVVFGIILGGRLGYVIFYDFYQIQHDYLRAIRIWDGGMSFHGGVLGLIIGLWCYCLRQKLQFLQVTDLAACAAPIGLFLGRLANFINEELYGKPTNVPWAVIFPKVDGVPRHPSQLYEAGLEGIALFILMLFCFNIRKIQSRTGTLSGIFLVTYSVIRIFIEHYYREPDVHLGLLYCIMSMGQALSIPMLGLGLFLLVRPKAN